MKKKKPRTKAGLFFRIVFSILGVFIVLAFAGVLVFGIFTERISTTHDIDIGGGLKEGAKGIANFFTPIRERTNFVIFGTDEDGTRTDLIMVGCFNATTKSLDVISIPRDTVTTMPPDRVDTLQRAGRWVPANGVMRMNQVHHYAGEEYGLDFIVKQLEEELNVDIEYYVRVDLDAFRFIVDEIGGVEFDVPQRMVYNDPVQGLHIDLYPGLQTLDGADAEGLVRYRKSDSGMEGVSPSYAMADLKRVEVQQDFIRALVTQVLRKDNLISNANAMIQTFMRYVDTNFSVSDISKYLKYVKDLNVDLISTYTIPYNLIDSQVYIDQVETEKLVNEIFYSSESLERLQQSSSKGKKIQVLNGSFTDGLAGSTRRNLESRGYSVYGVGDYEGEKISETRIMVRNEGEGTDLRTILPNSKIVVDKDMPSEYDIIIILGTDAV